MGSGIFSVPGIYIETYVHDDMYVQLLITLYVRTSEKLSGKDILGPEGPYISFPQNFTKKYFFQKFDLFLIQLGEIFPKRQLKVEVCVKVP